MGILAAYVLDNPACFPALAAAEGPCSGSGTAVRACSYTVGKDSSDQDSGKRLAASEESGLVCAGNSESAE